MNSVPHFMKKIAGWVLLLAMFGGLFAFFGISKGWDMAAITFGFSIVGTGLIALALRWILD